MISVVGKVMASLAAIDYIKTAAIEYYINPHSPDNALSFGAACAIQI
jgi:hypothetical protein